MSYNLQVYCTFTVLFALFYVESFSTLHFVPLLGILFKYLLIIPAFRVMHGLTSQ